MILKNYTTNKNHIITISEIEKTLSEIGARKIMKDYDEKGNVTELSFQVIFNEKPMAIRLPARVDRIPSALRNIYNNEKLKSSQKSLIKKAMTDRERATNIGWRIIQDWLDTQIAVMTLDQINMLEALLPFTVTKGGATLYEMIEANNFDLAQTGKALIGYEEPINP